MSKKRKNYSSFPDDSSFIQNIDKYVEFLAWARWNYDLFLDLITPASGGIKLGLDQRVFLRCLARFPRVYAVFPRGYGKCVKGDTLILTDEGMKEIGDLFEIDESADETYLIPNQLTLQNKKGEREEVSMGVYSGIKETVRIETEEGHEIEVSLNHPLLTQGKWLKKKKWKRAEKLKVGDTLIMAYDSQVFGSDSHLTMTNARILGQRCRKYHEPIPKVVLQSNRWIILNFLTGLFEMEDGFQVDRTNKPIYFKTTNSKLAKQLMPLLLNFGFRPMLRKEGEGYELTIPPIEIPSRGQRLFETKIKSITPSQAPVYDLSVPQTHSFIGNGFVNHNTFIEVLGLMVTCVLYPGVELSLTAQTRESAAGLLEDKVLEIFKYYPLLADCCEYKSFTKDKAVVIFKNGSRITNLANHQSSKGKRRHRIMCEEAALLNDELFNDVLEPIANVPRRAGSYGHNPEELNGQIHFLTTAYFKGSEYDRCLKMMNNMADLTGDISIGAGWELACNLGRGESRSQILTKKENLSPLFFATNYCSKWVGSSDNCLIDIRKMFPLRTLEHVELKGDGKSEYYIGCDVARSNKTNNNQTSICIAKVKRNKKNLVSKIQIVNMINLPSGLNFTAQAIELKRLKYLFDARIVVVDANGLGQGLLEELLKEHIDPLTRKEYPAWNTTNTEDEPDTLEYDQCLFGLKAQGINHDIILNFISLFDGSGMVELLTKIDQNQYDSSGTYLDNDKLAHIQCDLFIEEVANLQLETLNGGKLGVKQSTKAIDKDRYSATCYCLYYIMKYENKTQEEINTDYTRLLQFKPPRYR